MDLTKIILNGTVTRLIKRRWKNKSGIEISAFDLRNRQPPELYVSFFMVYGENDDQFFESAQIQLSEKFSTQQKEFLIILDISECLEEINDEDLQIISFFEENLPHCGLYYNTTDLTKIQAAKTVLCYLANKKVREFR